MSYPQPKLSRVSALKLVKFYKNIRITADSVAPTESMNFISLWRSRSPMKDTISVK